MHIQYILSIIVLTTWVKRYYQYNHPNMKSIYSFHGSNHINFNAADMGVIPNTPIRWNSFLELHIWES